MASTFTSLTYHVVFSTKYRWNFITPDIREELYQYTGGIVRANKGVLLEIGGMPDHVHAGGFFADDRCFRYDSSYQNEHVQMGE